MEAPNIRDDAKAFRLKSVNYDTLSGEQKNFIADELINGTYTSEEVSKITGIHKKKLNDLKHRRK